MINLINKLKGRYLSHSKAVVISCYFNPQNSSYRRKAFQEFYNSIKHLNHRIVECVIGDAKPELEQTKYVTRIATPNLLWHKEAILNKIIKSLGTEYDYIFWVDADVIFTNKNWLVEGVEVLQTANICQPFEYCVHLDQDELEPTNMNTFATEKSNAYSNFFTREIKVWRSFCANHTTFSDRAADENYDKHGHVGMAWGARAGIVRRVPLYDKALVGGADHIIAHAAAGHIPHKCITKSFTENIEEIFDWSRNFYKQVDGKIGYVPGDLYHIWHGDIKKRQYLKRVQEFTPMSKTITKKDKNGLYVTDHKEHQNYVSNYFQQREVVQNDSFVESMVLGYLTNSTTEGTLLGGNIAGAIIGDMLNTSEDNNQNNNNNNYQQDDYQQNDVPNNDIDYTPNDIPNDTTQVDDSGSGNFS